MSFYEPYKYSICNGLSNQLLEHAAHLARAAKAKRPAEIPDAFIVNGAQQTNENVLPMANNSVPFEVVFDKSFFLERMQKLDIEVKFVDVSQSRRGLRSLPCDGVGSLALADPRIAMEILRSFKPSKVLQQIIDDITSKIRKRLDMKQGICLHHRDGADWHDHCQRWSSIDDGVYRGNCLGVPHRSFLASLEDRGLSEGHWVYYCGDHEIPKELTGSKYKVVTRDQVLPAKSMQAVKSMGKVTSAPRDIWALLDFFICGQFEHFIGNSVSTFSAIQIAMREGHGAYWYNSQSIPLSSLWNVYDVPIVYTFTELSMSSGRHYLQASIQSVKKHMPHNPIHVIYNGRDNVSFRNWLDTRDVIIHEHDPSWKNDIEQMRLNGDPQRSHLFLHAGNYFGTWQRIDIPFHIDYEYCILLDADTIILRPFTMADLGMNMTYGIAMAAEVDYNTTETLNAGVTLMNVPYLRQTHPAFLQFIRDHVSTGGVFDHPSPSDQGAYLVFYRNTTSLLQPGFNFKPYWGVKEMSVIPEPFILHFHGAKPHDYLNFLFFQPCPQAINFLCARARRLPGLCQHMQAFALVSKDVKDENYCDLAFQSTMTVGMCNRVLHTLVEIPTEQCMNLSSIVATLVKQSHWPTLSAPDKGSTAFFILSQFVVLLILLGILHVIVHQKKRLSYGLAIMLVGAASLLAINVLLGNAE